MVEKRSNELQRTRNKSRTQAESRPVLIPKDAGCSGSRRDPQGRKQSVDVTFPVGIIDRLENLILRAPLLFLCSRFRPPSWPSIWRMDFQDVASRRSSERGEDNTIFSWRRVWACLCFFWPKENPPA